MTLATLAVDHAAPATPADEVTCSADSQRAILVERAYFEYCRLCEAGAAPEPSEFCARYPAIQYSLAMMLSVHQAVQDDDHVLAKAIDGEATEELPWPKPGESFLGFHLQRELGRGAFSHVYLARETALGGRTVVVKVSRWGLSEAETLGRLAHPNIMPIYSVMKDERSGRSAVCMPYLGEGTLCDLLDRLAGLTAPHQAVVILDAARKGLAPAPPRSDKSTSEAFLERAHYVTGIRRLAEQLLDALAFIHQEGVSHRDLKPSNVLLTHSGEPILLDFNLSGDNRKREIAFGGTPAYASPEILRLLGTPGADSSGLDARTDLFSLGVILYELLTGQHPFAPPPPSTPLPQVKRYLLERHAAGAPAVRTLNPAVDRRLARLVDCCMAADPADRPASAQAALALLAGRLPPWRRLLRKVGARPRLGLAAMVGTTLAVAVLVVGLWATAPSELARAEHAYREGSFATAVEHFGQHLGHAPGDAHAWFMCGLAQLKLDQYALAAADFARAEELDSNGPSCACLGYALHQNGDLRSAAFYYNKALAARYETAALRNNLGYIHLKSQAPALALASLDRAIALDPMMQAAYLNRGGAYLRQAKLRRAPAAHAIRHEELTMALADLKQAMALGPASGELYREAAEACTELAATQATLRPEAIAYLTRALDQGMSKAVLRQRPFSTVLKSDVAFQALQDHPMATSAAFEAPRITPIWID